VSLSFVLGGVRSGKSRYAEALLGYRYDVTYLAAGARPADPVADPEWAARVAFHQASRQKTWRTIETTDLVGQLSAPGGPLLIDCLGTWLTALVDQAGAWDNPRAASLLLHREGTALLAALRETSRRVVIVSNEVGLSLVPLTPSGRVFQDELGRLNARVADAADSVFLVVAGRVIDLTGAPRVDLQHGREWGSQDSPAPTEPPQDTRVGTSTPQDAP
jgi:adenosylcobinamide kinase/adenosylcobinamide-phosphate guanylyltransferase